MELRDKEEIADSGVAGAVAKDAALAKAWPSG